MKALVAVQETEGIPAAVGGPCIEGELVWMIEPCPASMHDPDGPCPCARTFRGMFTDGVTRTAVVRDIGGMTRADYVSAMVACHEGLTECTCGVDPARTVDELIRLTRGVPEGTLFTRRVGLVEVEQM